MSTEATEGTETRTAVDEGAGAAAAAAARRSARSASIRAMLFCAAMVAAREREERITSQVSTIVRTMDAQGGHCVLILLTHWRNLLTNDEKSSKIGVTKKTSSAAWMKGI